MSLDREFIEQLKSKNDIVDVISAYAQVEKRGGSYWARCPLPGHMEKTPSFCINPVGQFFKCFGCGRGGDVISFIMEVESLNYVEAVRFLASRAGMEMPEVTSVDAEKQEKQRLQRETCLAILKDSAHFYVDNLKLPEAEPYLEYLASRGFDAKTVRKFGIGASLDYKSLPNYLLSKGYKRQDLVYCGVVSERAETGEISDFEGRRLIVPIIDNVGNVVAFGGRVLEKKPDAMKYKNTRETDIFVKNKTLYNINNLRKLKREKGDLPYVIMVEGYMDVIALSTFGFENVVASMGTSLTQEQAKLLLRYTDTVIISYDGDSAGQKATIRGLEILKNAGLNVKVLSLPDGLDPDEFVKERGAEAYKNLIDNALPLIDFKLEYLSTKFDIRTADGKRNYIDNALKVIAESDKEFEQEDLLKRLSSKTRVTFESLKRSFENKESISTVKVEDEKNAEPVSALVKAERFILYSFFMNEEFINVDDVYDLEFSDDKRRAMLDFVSGEIEEKGRANPSAVCDVLGNDFIDELNSILILGDEMDAIEREKYYKDSIRCVRIRVLKAEIAELNKYCQELTDIDERLKILMLVNKKTQQLNKLKTEDRI